jgi:predicted nucleic acid-binding protein
VRSHSDSDGPRPGDYGKGRDNSNRARRIWAVLESSGKMIGFYDLIVGATALERGSDVATSTNVTLPK